MPKIRRKVDSIYVAGPYTAATPEDVQANVERAIAVGEELLKLGLVVYVPHFSHFWEMRFPHDYETWMKLDFGIIPKFASIFRMEGSSSGADREVRLATGLAMPVFQDVEAVREAVARGYVEVEVPDTAICWFCGKTRREVQALIANEGAMGVSGVTICDECVGLANGVTAGVPGAMIRVGPAKTAEPEAPPPEGKIRIDVTPPFPIQSMGKVSA